MTEEEFIKLMDLKDLVYDTEGRAYRKIPYVKIKTIFFGKTNVYIPQEAWYPHPIATDLALHITPPTQLKVQELAHEKVPRLEREILDLRKSVALYKRLAIEREAELYQYWKDEFLL